MEIRTLSLISEEEGMMTTEMNHITLKSPLQHSLIMERL